MKDQAQRCRFFIVGNGCHSVCNKNKVAAIVDLILQ